jgi:hypothetical protein
MARPDAHGYLGRGLQKLGKPGEALKALRAAVRAEKKEWKQQRVPLHEGRDVARRSRSVEDP